MLNESTVFDRTDRSSDGDGTSGGTENADGTVSEDSVDSVKTERRNIRNNNDKIDLNSIDAGKISQKTILYFLKNGTVAEVDDFTEEYFSSIGYEVMESMMLRQYVLVEALLNAAAFMKTVGIEGDELKDILGDLNDPAGYASSVDTAKEYIIKLLNAILEYRK
jgi:hypothetical protein